MRSGSHCSEAQKEKISNSLKGRVVDAETYARLVTAFSGRKHTNETKAKIAASRAGKPHPHKGHACSLETRTKIAISEKGKIISDVAREKISASITGRHHLPETRLKISEAHKGKKFSDEHKAKLSKIASERRGEKNSNWRGGLSFEPYCPKFNEDLKKRIREFFDNRCTMCGNMHDPKKRKLSCHHVEYNKLACCDGKPVHFAALCHRCHGWTSTDRMRWEAMLHRIIDEIYEGRSYFTKEEYEHFGGKDAENKV